MSAIGKLLPGIAARKIDSRRRHGAVGRWAGGVLGSRRRPDASWNAAVGLRKKIQCPVFIRKVSAKFSLGRSKSRIFGYFREESPPQEASASRLYAYVKR
jgi:hypothetical protein